MKAMHNKLAKVPLSWALSAIACVFFTSVLLNQVLLDKYRIDLTQGGLYSISQGSHELLEKIAEPINLYFFFSDKSSEGLTPLRNYANRIETLLKEYQLHADGKIKLHIIDPEPFSAAEDKAAAMGLTAAPISPLGDAVYLGLAGTNSLDDKQVITFFDPSQETLLEYQVSKLIYNLLNPEPATITVLSSLPILGQQNPTAGQMMQASGPWASFRQLQQLYQLQVLATDTQEIPEQTKVLLLLHPKHLSDEQLYAIDQYVMAGGKLLVFVDPLAEGDAQVPGMMGIPEPSSSDLAKLFTAWGVEYSPDQIVIDAAKGLEVMMPSGMPGRHLGYLGLDLDNIDAEDAITHSLSSINGASMGHLAPAQQASTQFTPLLQSSEYVDLTDPQSYMMAASAPESLLDNFTPIEQPLTLAARISSQAKSAFTHPPEGQSQAQHIAQQANIQVVLVADTDILTDAFWVQVTDFFGEQMLQPFANNADLLINAVDNLSGGSDLLAIRAKGQYQRPFNVVEQLTVEAEAKFREQEQLLQTQLQQTEDQLAQLQSQQGEAGSLLFTAEQEAAIDEFVAKKLEIRKQLREVRHQLDKDIEALGVWLKVVNIALMPLLLTLLLALIAKKLSRSRPSIVKWDQGNR